LRATTGLPVTVARYTGNGVQVALPDPQRPIPAGDLAAANLHASALGRILLAVTPAWRSLLPKHALNRITPRTVTDPSRLVAELVRIHRAGYAVQVEELHPGLGCVAVPVNDASGRLRAGLAVSAPCDVIMRQLPELASRLISTATDLTPLLTATLTPEAS
jgi:DNA-binding IclR family transcriptional regulator